MTAPKFTPGPWFLHDFADAAVSSDPKSPTNICVSCTTPDHLTVASMGRALTGTLDEARANAALIAAAPELYAALTEMLRFYEAVDWHDQFGDECDFAVPKRNAARAALAKARGETP